MLHNPPRFIFLQILSAFSFIIGGHALLVAQVTIKERVHLVPIQATGGSLQFNSSGITAGDTAECTIALINSEQIYNLTCVAGVFFDSTGAFQLAAEDTQRVLLHGGPLIGINLPNGHDCCIGADDFLTVDLNGTRVIDFSYASNHSFLDPQDAGVDIHQALHVGTNSYHVSAWELITGEDNGITPLRITIPTALRFRVTFARDTIQYGDTSAITVVAVDANNNEVTIPGSTSLMFSATQDIDTLWGYFIDHSGQRQFSPLMNVSYTDARAGRVKFLANSLWDWASGNLHPSFVKVEGGRRIGYRNIFLGAVKLRFLGPDSVRVYPHYAPHNTSAATSDTIGLDVLSVWGGSNVAAKYVPVKMPPPTLVDNGGHSHGGIRPKGKYQVKTGATWTIVDSSIQITDVSGTLHTRFQASDLGGIEQLRFMPLRSAPGIFAQKKVSTCVPGLVRLGAGTNYTKEGGTCEHHGPLAGGTCAVPDTDHYCDSILCARIPILADSFAVRYPGIKLRVNDMSLPLGGKFDIAGDWLAVSTHHAEHRVGKNADLPVSTFTSAQEDTLWNFLSIVMKTDSHNEAFTRNKQTGKKVYKVHPHYHVRYKP
jgi:hypothetical protein